MADPLVISILNRKYAQLMGKLRQCEGQAKQLRADLVHVEATIRLFRAEWDSMDIPPVHPKRESRWSRRGEGIRTMLAVLRQANEPLTAQQIALRCCALLNMPKPDKAALRAMGGPINSALIRRLGKDVVASGGKPKRWSLTTEQLRSLRN